MADELTLDQAKIRIQALEGFEVKAKEYETAQPEWDKAKLEHGVAIKAHQTEISQLKDSIAQRDAEAEGLRTKVEEGVTKEASATEIAAQLDQEKTAHQALITKVSEGVKSRLRGSYGLTDEYLNTLDVSHMETLEFGFQNAKRPDGTMVLNPASNPGDHGLTGGGEHLTAADDNEMANNLRIIEDARQRRNRENSKSLA